jgi:ATP-dependent DNA helicase RecG
MDRLSADYIQALVQAGESQTVEFKPESESQGDVGELLAALANTDGGIILFGVTDTQEIVGVKRLETVYNRIQAAARACRPPLNLYLTVYTVEVAGRPVVVAQLPAGGTDLYSYAGVYRRRQGSYNVLLMAEEMKQLIRTRMSEDFDSQPLPLGLEALDPAQVQQLLALRIELMQIRGQPELATRPSIPIPLYWSNWWRCAR